LKPTPCLWFDGRAKEAAEFYTSIFPDSRIDRIQRSPSDYPSGKAGDVLTVEFTIDGAPFVALNGGPEFTFNESISFMIDCADQGEVDRYWDALVRGGGEHSQCGWLKDRFGVSWQVVPSRLNELLEGSDPDGVRRTFDAMMEMQKLDIAKLEEAYVNPERVPAGVR
jgi:predicted 3-demethylubiquinone-9 3-methyltransferase (glyoxalase superfamily)